VLVHVKSGGRWIAVGIENKIDAPVGSDQLLRYPQGLVNKFGTGNVALLLLAPTERANAPGVVDGCTFSSLTYRSVVAALEGALAARNEPSSVTGAELARHYLEFLRNNIRSRCTRAAESAVKCAPWRLAPRHPPSPDVVVPAPLSSTRAFRSSRSSA
jgi:hypothetical protein